MRARTNSVTDDSRLVRVSALAAQAACVLGGLCLYRRTKLSSKYHDPQSYTAEPKELLLFKVAQAKRQVSSKVGFEAAAAPRSTSWHCPTRRLFPAPTNNQSGTKSVCTQQQA
jgi:hypothetical protein